MSVIFTGPFCIFVFGTNGFFIFNLSFVINFEGYLQKRRTFTFRKVPEGRFTHLALSCALFRLVSLGPCKQFNITPLYFYWNKLSIFHQLVFSSPLNFFFLNSITILWSHSFVTLLWVPNMCIIPNDDKLIIY